MNTRRLGRVIFPVLVLNLSLWTGRPHRMNKVTTVPMDDAAKHGMVGVSCQINGAGRSYLCVIDTGAIYTLISDRVLKGEGPLTNLSTANGVIHVHERAVSLTLADGLELKFNAYVQSNMTLQDVDILVGQDVLRQFRSVIFDYEKQQVEFHR